MERAMKGCAMMRRRWAVALIGQALFACVAAGAAPGADDITDPRAFEMRPNPMGEWNLGQIGVTGIRAHIEKGLKVTIEGTEPGTPAKDGLLIFEVSNPGDGANRKVSMSLNHQKCAKRKSGRGTSTSNNPCSIPHSVGGETGDATQRRTS